MNLIGALKWLILYLALFSRWNPVLFCLSRRERGHGLEAGPRQTSFNSRKNNSLIRVNIDRFQSNSRVEYKYDRYSNQHIFTARDPYFITEVVDDRESLWKSRSNDYPIKVILAYDENGEEELKLFYPILEEEASSDSDFDDSSFIPIKVPDSPYTSYSYLALLNIKKRFCTDLIDYEYDKKRDTHKFTAIEPFLFGIIKKGDKTIWEPETPEYPDTVFLFPAKGGRYVMRLYYATIPEPPQVPEVFVKPTKPLLPEVPEVFVKPAKPLVPEEPDLSYLSDLSDHLLKPEKSAGISYSTSDLSEHLMKPDKSAGIAYSTSDLSDLDQLQVSRRERPKKLTKIDLNLSDPQPGDDYELVDFENYHTNWLGTYIYKANPGFKFNSVIQDKHNIWEAKKEDELAEKIGYSSSFTGVEQVIVYQANGVKRKFYKTPGFFFGHWEEEFLR